MDLVKPRLVPIGEGVVVPVPTELSPEEEAAILSAAKAEFDPIASEAECRELVGQLQQGRLVSAEDMLRTMERIEKFHGP